MSECNRKTCKLSGDSIPELGDGEPSPPPAKQPRTFIGVRNHRETVLASLLEELVVIKQVNACCFKVWFGGVFTGVEGSEVAAKNKANVMINSILRKLRSGAAQEVSPPSLVRMKDGSLVHSNPCPKCGRTEIHKLCSDVPPRETDGHPVGWCCKHCYDGGYQAAMRLSAEGDTRELKAALKLLTENFFPAVCVHDAEPDYCDCCRHEWEIELRERKDAARRLLGSD